MTMTLESTQILDFDVIDQEEDNAIIILKNNLGKM